MKRQADGGINDQEVLQEINMNIPESQGAPFCKKPKLHAETGTNKPNRWSLNTSTLVLDEVYDRGVKLLESGSESSPEGDAQRPGTDSTDQTDSSSSSMTPESRAKEIALLEATLTKETLQKVAEGNWNNLVQKDKEPRPRINQFQHLSDEMVLHIFHWLPKSQLPNVALVCKRFHQLSQDKSLWTRMDVSSRNLEPGALGQILSRQIVILRLAQAEIADPVFLPGVKSSMADFRARLLYLDLSMAQISKQSLTDLLGKCHRLKKISLEHVPVDDNVLLALSMSKDIEVINFAMVEGIEEDGMRYLLGNCRKLKEFNIAWTGLSSSCIKYICSNLPPTMDRLNLSGCQKYMIDKHVADLVPTCPNLRELDLSDCTGLTGTCVQYISLLDDLNFLALSRCYFIPYQSLLSLKHLRSLAYLDIHGGHIDAEELKTVQNALGTRVHLNKFKFSSVARPTVGARRSSIWGMSVRN